MDTPRLRGRHFKQAVASFSMQVGTTAYTGCSRQVSKPWLNIRHGKLAVAGKPRLDVWHGKQAVSDCSRQALAGCSAWESGSSRL